MTNRGIVESLSRSMWVALSLAFLAVSGMIAGEIKNDVRLLTLAVLLAACGAVVVIRGQ